VSDNRLEELGVNVIRGLALDAPQRAHSGHTGAAMALAPLAHVLFTRVMNHDPSDPAWPDRDRFVLSNGHASILLYSLLYLTGYGLELEDLRSFRQWGSKTPGHPEAGHTLGVEVTTGPLGQGVADGVGLGIAERFLRARFGPETCDHHTFVIAGDGCLMEGVSHEAASLAGHLGLGRLIYIYDDNHITIDGSTALSCDDDVVERFSSYGWHVESVGEIANDLDGLEASVRRAIAAADQPSLIVLRSHIGWPAPHLTDSAKAHGDPFGEEEIRLTKELLGLPADEQFYVPEEVLAFYRQAGAKGRARREAWESRQATIAAADREAFSVAQAGGGLPGWRERLPRFEAGKSLATRRAIKQCLDAVAPSLPGLIAGSADLTGNTGVALEGATVQSGADPGGRQLHYGIREHAMGAAMTGMALHGGVLPVGGTFFVFSDYMRPAIRLAALSGAHVIYFFTHDSIGLGEDGPTHQPVEQLASLRAMPGLRVIRPADANETAVALAIAIERDGPTALVLSRQDLPILAETAEGRAEGVLRGAYVLRRSGVEGELGEDEPEIILVGTGSEVQLCLEAARLLEDHDVAARVVSFPCFELFEDEDEEYQEAVLPADVPVLAVEAAASFGWDRYADDTVTIDHFGASAPGPVVMEHFGFTAQNVAARARQLLDLT
jgi:transketolase